MENGYVLILSWDSAGLIETCDVCDVAGVWVNNMICVLDYMCEFTVHTLHADICNQITIITYLRNTIELYLLSSNPFARNSLMMESLPSRRWKIWRETRNMVTKDMVLQTNKRPLILLIDGVWHRLSLNNRCDDVMYVPKPIDDDKTRRHLSGGRRSTHWCGGTDRNGENKIRQDDPHMVMQIAASVITPTTLCL